MSGCRLQRSEIFSGVRCLVAIALVVLASTYGCGSNRGGHNARMDPASSGIVNESADHYMGRLAKELSKIEGASTERKGKEIKITWIAAYLFDLDSAMLNRESEQRLGTVGDILARFAATDIVISASPESADPSGYKRTLFERRALSIRDFLVDLGVPPSRLEIAVPGAAQPGGRDDARGRVPEGRVIIEIRPDHDPKPRTTQGQFESSVMRRPASISRSARKSPSPV